MYFPEGQVRVHLYGRPVDMRRSFDGLSALTSHTLSQDPMSGALFVFINRKRPAIDLPNHRRLLKPIGDIPPSELEQSHYQQQEESAKAA